MTDDLRAEVEATQELLDEIRRAIYDDTSFYDKAHQYETLLRECLIVIRKAYKGAVK